MSLYWTDEGPAITKIQRADEFVQAAQDCMNDVSITVPWEAWKLIQERIITIRRELDKLSEALKFVDPDWCDHCERWTDDPMHRASCDPQPDEDEYDRQKDALMTQAVYGPLGTSQGGTDD